MQVEEAQREVRSVYLGGAVGAVVAGVLWLVAAALGIAVGKSSGIWTLVVGGAFIFPVTQLVLRLMGRRASLSPENPLRFLAMQIAFTVPLALPVIGAASLHNVNWFFPSFMVIVGAHYLPFAFLYGMWEYTVLAALLIVSGVWVGMTMPRDFDVGGWLGGAMLLLFAVIVWFRRVRGEGAKLHVA